MLKILLKTNCIEVFILEYYHRILTQWSIGYFNLIKINSTRQHRIHIKLLRNGSLTNAAVVLFAKEMNADYMQCMIKMARFQGTDKTANFIDNQRVYGNAFYLLSEAEAFIRRHLPIASFFDPDQFERIDKPTLPALAVREAIINAICHRDYMVYSSDITLAIFDDRMEIWNSGNLPPPLTIKDLKKEHASLRRNELVADVFYRRKYIDIWGTGIERMIKLCQALDIPEPEFS